MLSRYGSVLIKGLKKERVDVLKNAGLAHDYGKENLQTVEKNVNMKGYVQDLKPETWFEINYYNHKSMCPCEGGIRYLAW